MACELATDMQEWMTEIDNAIKVLINPYEQAIHLLIYIHLESCWSIVGVRWW